MWDTTGSCFHTYISNYLVGSQGPAWAFFGGPQPGGGGGGRFSSPFSFKGMKAMIMKL